MHTFTCHLRDAGPAPELYSDNRETRAFDIDRYTWAYRLHSIIRNLGKRKCYFAGDNNYATVDTYALPQSHEYQVYFDLRRIGPDLIELYVQSAYVNRESPLAKRSRVVGFKILVGHALFGKKPKPPPQ